MTSLQECLEFRLSQILEKTPLVQETFMNQEELKDEKGCIKAIARHMAEVVETYNKPVNPYPFYTGPY